MVGTASRSRESSSHFSLATLIQEDPSLSSMWNLNAQGQKRFCNGTARNGARWIYRRLVDEQGNLLVAEDHRALTTRFRSHQAAHGSWIFQRQVFERIGGYREATNYWEDGDAFIRFAEVGPIRIVPEVLYTYRFHANNARSHITARQRELWSKSTTEARPNLGLSIPPAIYSNAHWLGKRAPLIRRLFLNRLWPTSPSLLVVWLFAMFAGSFPRPCRYLHCMAIDFGAALSRNKHAKMTAVVWKAAPRLWTGTVA